MATITENAAIVVSAARQMKAIIELAEQLGDIQLYEQRLGELQKQLHEETSKIFDAKHELTKAEEDAVAAKEEAAKLRKDATAAAKAIREKAEIFAKAKVSDATEEAGKLLSVAKTQASAFDKRVVTATAELDQKKVELAEAEKQLASTQQKLRKLVEGVTQNGNL